MYGDDGTLDPFWGCAEDLENSVISSNLDTYGKPFANTLDKNKANASTYVVARLPGLVKTAHDIL